MIKKAFFDMWDNLLSIILLNLGCTLIIGAGAYIPYILGFHQVALLLGTAIAIIMLILYIGVTSMFARDIADYRSPEFKKFFQYLKEVWKSALAFSFLIFVQFLIFTIVLPWYIRMGGMVGIAATTLLFWVSVIWWLASQYYFPVRSRLDPNIKKIIFKCFVLFFDNTPFTLFLGFGTLVILILSGFTAFLFPGIGTILLWHQVGLKLRMYKYDYLEAHPNANRKSIPWNILLMDDRERVGRRTLRGMIFPWKE